MTGLILGSKGLMYSLTFEGSNILAHRAVGVGRKLEIATMRWLVGALVGLAVGYLLGAGIGAVLVSGLSSNTHDKSQEIAMTAFFAAGPAGALIGLIVGLVRARRTFPATRRQ